MDNNFLNIFSPYYAIFLEMTPVARICLAVPVLLTVSIIIVFLFTKYIWPLFRRIFIIVFFAPLGYILYRLIISSKKQFLLYLDKKYYEMADKLEKGATNNKSGSVGRVFKSVVAIAFLLIIWFGSGIVVQLSDNEGLKELSVFNTPLNFYFNIEEKLANKLGTEMPVWIEQKITAKTPGNASPTSSQTVYFKLSDEGINGSNIRIEPGTSGDSTVVAVVSGDIVLEYLNESIGDDRGIMWYKVMAKSGEIGWISGKLVKEIN